MRRVVVTVVLLALVLGVAPAALGTIHPIVESFDCANEEAFDNHPLGDPADPIGQTPGVGNHSETSSLRALFVITDGFNDLSSPALFGQKLNGECGTPANG